MTGSNEPQTLAALLPIGCLLTLAGGYLDAYSWLAHGHVFANAQTGNVVYMGLNVAARQWHDALAHAIPVLTFIGGALLARLLGVKATKRTYTATLLSQAVELAVLLLLLFGQRHIPDAVFVPAIALAAALQITSFGALGPLTFNSAMTSSNLLHAVAGAFDWLHNGSAEGRTRAGVYACIVGCFAAGAVLGAYLTRIMPEMALLPCVAALVLATVLTYRLHIQHERQFPGFY